MTLFKIFAVIVTLALIAISSISTSTVAKPDYSKKEKKVCTFCHTSKNIKENSEKDLNDAGKYYKEKKTLEGYKPKDK
jgi:hypothetical protein